MPTCTLRLVMRESFLWLDALPDAMHLKELESTCFTELVINKLDAYKAFSIFKTSQCKLPTTSGDTDHFHTWTQPTMYT